MYAACSRRERTVRLDRRLDEEEDGKLATEEDQAEEAEPEQEGQAVHMDTEEEKTLIKRHRDALKEAKEIEKEIASKKKAKIESLKEGIESTRQAAQQPAVAVGGKPSG